MKRQRGFNRTAKVAIDLVRSPVLIEAQLAAAFSDDKNVSAANDGTSLYTFGLNWFFADRTKLQVNFEYLRKESGRMANQALLVQFQAGF